MIARIRKRATFKPIQLRRTPEDQLVYWQTMAMQWQANMNQYKSIAEQIAGFFGSEAYKNEDGTVSKTVVYPTVIKLIKERVNI